MKKTVKQLLYERFKVVAFQNKLKSVTFGDGLLQEAPVKCLKTIDL